MSPRRILLQTKYRTPAFSLFLGSIATAMGAGCALDTPVTGTGGSDGLDGQGPGPGGAVGAGGSAAVGSGGSTPNSTVVATHELCLNERASLIDGLNPAVELDSLAEYHGSTDHLCTAPDYGFTSMEGKPCSSADEEQSCHDEVERLRAGSADWGRYEDFWTASFGLLIATGSEEAIERLGGPVDALTGETCGSWSRGGPPLNGEETTEEGLGGADGGSSGSANATTIADRETLLTLLGTIDTANEGALVLWANNFNAPCSLEELADGRYRAVTTEQISDCPVTQQDYQVTVAPDGTVSSSEVGGPRESDVCVGRRPHGLEAARDASWGTAEGQCFEGQWLADVARLEAAAVVAFVQTSRFLEQLGAPAELVTRARTAAQDEVRHARDAQALATARGARPRPAVVDLVRERTLLSLALENAVEGCIRECWGALVAHYQARAATDPDVRAFFGTVAEEESSHALLSMDLADWFDTRLTAAERELVAAARRKAIVDLTAELGRDEPASAALGLPDRDTRLALVRELEARVWQPLAA